MRSYTSLMSKSTYIRSHSVAAYTIIYRIFNSFRCATSSPCIPLTTLFLKEWPVEIRRDGCKTLLRTLLLLQGRTAKVSLVILAVIHLLAGTDSEDERKGEVCLFQVNMPPGLPTHPKQTDLQGNRTELADARAVINQIYVFYLSHLCISFAACPMSHTLLMRRSEIIIAYNN